MLSLSRILLLKMMLFKNALQGGRKTKNVISCGREKRKVFFFCFFKFFLLMKCCYCIRTWFMMIVDQVVTLCVSLYNWIQLCILFHRTRVDVAGRDPCCAAPGSTATVPQTEWSFRVSTLNSSVILSSSSAHSNPRVRHYSWLCRCLCTFVLLYRSMYSS